jgi:preprotein translocase subunit SecF
MNKKILDTLNNFKAWMALVAVIISVAGVLTVYAQMPKKVETLEKRVEDVDKQTDEKVKAVDKKVDEKAKEQDEKIAENKDQVQQVASSVDKFIAVQAEQRKADEEHKQMMLKILEQVADKKGR